MERKMNETIEEKVFRTFIAAFADASDIELPSFEEAINDSDFARVCQAVEILIAEEREACAEECDKLVGWHSAVGNPAECAERIRARSAAPKDEVSK